MGDSVVQYRMFISGKAQRRVLGGLTPGTSSRSGRINDSSLFSANLQWIFLDFKVFKKNTHMKAQQNPPDVVKSV